MVCRNGFLKLARKSYWSMVAGAKLAESWADLFGSLFSSFSSVLGSVMLFCDFLLSSPTVGYVDLDLASLSFWKIFSEKIEPDSGRTHVHEKSEILKNLENCWNWILELDFISILNCVSWNAGVGNFQNAEGHGNSSETHFLEHGKPQDLPGSCAARNIQDFGEATCLVWMVI